MKSRKHTFAPSLDGRLEDRLVLNGAHHGAVFAHHGDANVPREAVLSTRAYNNILVNIHRSVTQFGRSAGTQGDYNRLTSQVDQQLARLPYAHQAGLVDGVNDSLQYYAPGEFRELYSDIRSTVAGYVNDGVADGSIVVRKSGRFFSDADIIGVPGPGPGPVVPPPGPGPVVPPVGPGPGHGHGHGPGPVTPNFPREAVLTSRAYNNVLVNVHRSVVQFSRTAGTQGDYNRLANQVGQQLGRLPYARQNGLIDYVNGSLEFYGPREYQELYSDVRSTVISYLGDQVGSGSVAIRKSPGHFFSDADIIGPNAPIYNPPVDVA